MEATIACSKVTRCRAEQYERGRLDLAGTIFGECPAKHRRTSKQKEGIIDWIEQEVFRLDQIEYERRHDDLDRFAFSVERHNSPALARTQHHQRRLVVRSVIAQMRKPRRELMEEIACGAGIAHADVMHRQGAARGERPPEAVDRHIVKVIEPTRIRSLVGAASVAVAKKDLFGPFLGLFHAIQLLIKRNGNPACPAEKASGLCRRRELLEAIESRFYHRNPMRLIQPGHR